MNLYPYQSEDVAILADSSRKILAHQPGLGKTAISVRALETKYATDSAARFLIIASKSAIGTWQAEIETWGCGDRPVVALPEGRAARALCLHQFERGYLIVNREAVRILIDELLAIGFWAVVLDEAHHARSRPARADRKTGRSQFVAALFKLKAQTMYAISATLLDGNPQQLWPTLYWLWPRQYRSFWKFSLKYCEFNQDGYSMIGTYAGPRNQAALRAELAPLILRRLKSEVAPELPPLRFQTVPIQLSTAERKPYDAMRDTLMAEFENNTRLMASAKVAQLTRLSQMAVCAGTFDKSIPSTKLEWVMDYMAGVPAGQSVVIASRFREPLIQLAAMLTAQHISHSLLIGGVAERPALMRDFQDGRVQVCLITIATGGESINLSRADIMIVTDKSWSSIEWEQLAARVHRNDALTRSHQSVLVISLVAEDTVDIAVERVLERKGAINDEIILSTAMQQMRKTGT